MWKPVTSRAGVQKYYTIDNLRLDVKAAEEGRTWLLLPDGFRALECGKSYPLPSYQKDLRELALIVPPPGNVDAGVIYLRRAMSQFRKRRGRKVSALIETDRRSAELLVEHGRYRKQIDALKAEAEKAVDKVKAAANQQIANLSDLFALGRQGIEGQMRAHLDETKWKKETISARDFRECFRMVSQAVKGLGLPSEQRDKAREAVMEEAAAALQSTQEVLAMAPGGKEPEVTH
jgi:hypothetical protein